MMERMIKIKIKMMMMIKKRFKMINEQPINLLQNKSILTIKLFDWTL